MSVTKNAIIAGGATGIGFAAAAALLSAGYSVTIAGRRSDVLEESAEKLRALSDGPLVMTYVVDISTETGPVELVERHVAKFGGVDAVVITAGIFETLPFEQITASSWDKTMNGTLRGPALIAAAAGRHMAQVGSGRMVFIGSVNGHYSEPESGVYSAAKAAIASLARSVVVDLASRGVIANTVSPGWVETPMTAEILPHATPEKIKEMIPIGRVGRPEELAKVIRFLVVDAPDYLCGANIVVDGGQTALAPSW